MTRRSRREQLLDAWELIRRHAVPRRMIERATERRLAGDWRGACAAAHVDVEIDPDHITPAMEDDLRHLAPDLLRWHLPRARLPSSIQGTSIVARRALLLGEYGGRRLYVATPPVDGAAQRLRLRSVERIPGHHPPSGALIAREDWSRLRHLWDARHTGKLLAHHGNGERLPFFHPDGTPLGDDELPQRDPGPDDPAVLIERAFLLREHGQWEVGAVIAGLPYEATGFGPLGSVPLLGMPLANTVMLVREARALAAAEGVAEVRIDTAPDASLVLRFEGGRIQTRTSRHHGVRAVPVLTEACWQSPDLDLLRTGRITPEELHPLVRDALFPARAPAAGPVGPSGPPPPAPFLVRCRDGEHEVRWRDGRMALPHPADEVRREQALRALGGRAPGCFALSEVWTGAARRLPYGLDQLRRSLFECVQHDDVPGLLGLLDAGVDPRVRDFDSRTLLHSLHMTDHEVVLPRLLAAGLSVDATDRKGATPLYRAVEGGASAECVRALLEAGARTDVVNEAGRSLRDVVDANRYAHLGFLRDLVAARHPVPRGGESVDE